MLKKIAIGCGVLVALGFIVVVGALIAIGVAMETGRVPDTKVLEGPEISKSVMAEIAEVVDLEKGETVEYYYSAGIFDHQADMNIVTDRRVITHSGGDGVDYTEAIRIDDMVSVSVDVEGSFLEDTVLSIGARDGNEIYLVFSAEEGRDKRVIRHLEGLLGQARSEPADTVDESDAGSEGDQS